VARAEGDLAAARNEYQVSFDIFARLTDLDPWRSDLEIAWERLDNLDQSAEGQA
jgi:hypothetical protein